MMLLLPIRGTFEVLTVVLHWTSSTIRVNFCTKDLPKGDKMVVQDVELILVQVGD